MANVCNVITSVALIHELADLPIHRYLFYNTADTDTDTDVFIIKFFLLLVICTTEEGCLAENVLVNRKTTEVFCVY